MIEQRLRWTPPAPQSFWVWDGESIDELRRIVELRGEGWTVTPDSQEVGTVTVNNGTITVDILSPGDVFERYRDGSYKTASGYENTIPYPSKWLS